MKAASRFELDDRRAGVMDLRAASLNDAGFRKYMMQFDLKEP